MANQVDLDHKFFISLALKNEIAWSALKLIIEGLTSTLEKSKEVNRFLLEELEKFHVKFQSLGKLQSINQDKGTESEPYYVNNHEQDDTLENTGDDIFETNKGQNSLSNDAGYYESHSEREIDNEWYTFVSNDKAKTQVAAVETEMVNHEIENLKLAKETVNEEKQFELNNGKIFLKLRENDNFLSKNEKSTELIAKQANEKQLQCTFCQKAFQKSSNLVNHERIHTGEVPFECMTCNKRFKTKGVLKLHERFHTGELPYECDTCRKRYKTKSELKTHERIHTGEVPFECKTCQKRFNQKCNLKKHERIHTGEVKKSFQCTFCQKAFQYSGNLKIHERIHTGEVPFECKTCKKRFKQRSDLKKHERIHTGEVPYECKSCKKRFKDSSALKIHERNHTGEEPYECKTCGKRFKQTNALRFHEKHHL